MAPERRSGRSRVAECGGKSMFRIIEFGVGGGCDRADRLEWALRPGPRTTLPTRLRTKSVEGRGEGCNGWG